MIEKITHDKISLTLPTVFGDELTFLEFCGKMRSKLNECIGVVNENTSNISKNELSIATTDAALNELRTDFLKRRAEALFAPVILNVESHELGADINASVYIRLGRIDYKGLGCLYAKVNISFSGATDAKTLKILSVQFGKRSIISLENPAPIFTVKTGVINLPISVVGTIDMPAGSSDMTVTGVNFFGAMDGITDTVSAFTLNDIPTGKDILCDSLTFTSPGGSEQDSKVLYILRVVEGQMDILTTAAGTSASTGRAYLYIDFADVISNSKIYTQFLCQGGSYNSDTISTVPDNGAALGSALINYLEDGTTGGEVYGARTILTIEQGGGTPNLLKKPGNISKNLPTGQVAHISLTFDLFR